MEKDINNKKSIIASLLIIFAVMLITTASFALFNVVLDGTQTNRIIIEAPVFDFKFTESNSVSLTNPDSLTSSENASTFDFSVRGSTTDTRYTFNVDYIIYLKVNVNNTIANNKIYVQLFDGDNNQLTRAFRLSELSLVTDKTDSYVLKVENMSLQSGSITKNYALKYWFNGDGIIDYTENGNSQTASGTLNGTFSMSVNAVMDDYSYIQN